MKLLSDDDQNKIAEAIDVVDQQSDGEIYVLVAQESSEYPEVPFAWGAIAALLVPPVALALGLTPDFLSGFSQDWHMLGAQTHETLYVLTSYVLVQSAMFGIVAFIVSLSAVRPFATPHILKRARVERAAAQHFTSTGMHLKDTQPHVLIYVALREHRVEIIAAPAIHAIVGNAVWEEARDAIVSGIAADAASALCRAVEIIGAPLIRHFPATATHPDINAHGVGEI